VTRSGCHQGAISKEARPHVARRTRSQQKAPRRLKALARRVEADGEPVRAVIESMTGARFVHDTLERYGWEVLIADARKVRGLARWR
jgi:hypothetical protein